MAKIEFGFSQKDAYDFVIKTETRKTTKENGMTVTEKLHKPIYKNPEIDMWGYTDRITAENAPSVLKNVEFFTAPNPFGKYGLGHKYEPYGWTLPMAMLAFKKGYIDGFLSHKGGLFGPLGQLSTEGIIIVDPIQRIKVREWVEEEYKGFFENCKEEDFAYSLTKFPGAGSRIGMSLKENSVDELKENLMKDKDYSSENFFQTDREKEAVETYGFYKVFDALANLLYYDTDLVSIWGVRTARPLLFNSLKEAEDFKVQYKEWETIYRDESKAECNIILVNEKFDEYLEELRKPARDKLEEEVQKRIEEEKAARLA